MRSPVAWRHTDHEEAPGRVALAQNNDGLDAQRLVYAISCCLHGLLLDDLEHLLVQGSSVVGVVSADADDEDTSAYVCQCYEIIGKVVGIVDLSLEVKVPSFEGTLADEALDPREGICVGRDAETGK